MYGLPEDFTGTFLVGRVLEQICFSQNQICLHFDSNVSITIESAFSHDYGREAHSTIIYIPALQSDLMQFLGFSISEVFGKKDGTLCLVFENGQTFKCFDTSPQFESYHIKHGERVIIV